jgi:hypothetical protein
VGVAGLVKRTAIDQVRGRALDFCRTAAARRVGVWFGFAHLLARTVMSCIRVLSVLSTLLIAGTTFTARAETASVGKSISFDCADGSTIAATYYFAPPRLTPLRVTATYGGGTHELIRDRDDASGWGFGDTVVTLTVSGGYLVNGGKPIQCKVHNGINGGGVPAQFMN